MATGKSLYIQTYKICEKGVHTQTLFILTLATKFSLLLKFHSLTLSLETLWSAPQQWPLREDSILNPPGTRMSLCWVIWTNLINWQFWHHHKLLTKTLRASINRILFSHLQMSLWVFKLFSTFSTKKKKLFFKSIIIKRFCC